MKQITSQTAEVEAAAARAAADEIRIALTMLENMPSGARACDRGRDWFEEKFPDGGERAEVWDACPNWRWQVWFAVHSATTEEAVAFAQSCADRAAFYAVAAVAVAAKAAAAADAYDADTYNAAAYAYSVGAARAAAAYSAAHAAAAYAAEAADYAADAHAAAADADTYNAADAADAAAEAAADAADAAAEAEAAYEDAYAADAAAAAAVDDEIQAQVAWARGILFS